MTTVTVQSVSSRRVAGIFDLPVEGPEEVGGVHRSNEAIGGSYGIGWWKYFKDAKTGEIYRVHCTDGVYGGNGPYTHADEKVRQDCYYALLERFRRSAREERSEIRISRNERVVMQGFTHAALLEERDGTNGKQSNDGLEGGLVGHFHGIPVICDLELQEPHSIPA
ncbi:MAG: hypothetical protein HYW97_01060 [Candidatus Wildermuthbacteria bacterium]|nr:hypothetical protein [Candidatus Wildermuthbacteria bacterium]